MTVPVEYLIPICLTAFIFGIFTVIWAYDKSLRTSEQTIDLLFIRLTDCEGYLKAYDTSMCAEYWNRGVINIEQTGEVV